MDTAIFVHGPHLQVFTIISRELNIDSDVAASVAFASDEIYVNCKPTFKVISSLQEAKNLPWKYNELTRKPIMSSRSLKKITVKQLKVNHLDFTRLVFTWGSHLMAFTSLVWPWHQTPVSESCNILFLWWHRLKLGWKGNYLIYPPGKIWLVSRGSTGRHGSACPSSRKQNSLLISWECEIRKEIWYLRNVKLNVKNMKVEEREIPVDIKSRGRVKGKLLLAASCCCIPDYRRPDFTEDEMQQEVRKYMWNVLQRVELRHTCRLLRSEWNFPSCSTSGQILAPDNKIQE